MKKSILLLLMPLLSYAAAKTQPQDNCIVDKKCFYARVLAGANFLQNTDVDQTKCSYETGYIVSGSLGYYFYDGVHVEGEYAYRRNAIKKIHFLGQGSSNHGRF